MSGLALNELMRPEGTPDFPVHSGWFHRCHPHPARCAGFYRQDKTQRCKRVTARRRASFPVNGLCRQPEICMGKKKPWKLRHTLRLSVTSLPRFNRRGSGRVVGNWLGLQISKPDDKHGNANREPPEWRRRSLVTLWFGPIVIYPKLL